MAVGRESKLAAPTHEGIARLSELAQSPSVAGAVEAVRDLLGMDVAYATEFVGSDQVFRVLRGDGESFGVYEGFELPLEQTYCERVLAGRLPNLMPDVRADERAASLPVTEAADVGAFASVPLRLSDGRLFGTLCAGSHDAVPSLGYRDLQFLHVFARMIADQIEREELTRSAHRIELRATAASALMAAVESRDAYTSEHSQAVVALAVEVGRRLGLDEGQLSDVAQVAPLHDIGKIAVPDSILRKPGPLDEREWEAMRLHPVHGEQVIRSTPGIAHLAAAVRAEHEHWDGGGYPDGFAGDAIPLPSRITLVCDAYHAMTSDRPYRRAMDAETARDRIAAGIGAQFCPSAGRALLDLLDNESPRR